MTRAAALLLTVPALAACDFQKDADAQFGDQHFKTAISLLELQKLRFGTYPEGLKDVSSV